MVEEFYAPCQDMVGAGLGSRPRRVSVQDCHRELPALGGERGDLSVQIWAHRIATSHLRRDSQWQFLGVAASSLQFILS